MTAMWRVIRHQLKFEPIRVCQELWNYSHNKRCPVLMRKHRGNHRSLFIACVWQCSAQAYLVCIAAAPSASGNPGLNCSPEISRAKFKEKDPRLFVLIMDIVPLGSQLPALCTLLCEHNSKAPENWAIQVFRINLNQSWIVLRNQSIWIWMYMVVFHT